MPGTENGFMEVSMNTRRKQILTVVGITAFAVLILITFIQLSQASESFLVAYGLFQEMWSPIGEALLNSALSVLLGYYYGLTGILTGYEQVDLEFNHPDTDCAGFEEGDVLAFDYFVADEEKRPLPVWSAEVLGKENPNSKISRLNFVSAEGEILSIENENPHYMVVMAELENIGETEITLEAAWTLPEPGEYYEEGQKIRFYYEPPRENRIPGSVYIGSYEEQIVVLE